jgi:hypothetical protein
MVDDSGKGKTKELSNVVFRGNRKMGGRGEEKGLELGEVTYWDMEHACVLPPRLIYARSDCSIRPFYLCILFE